MGIMYILGCTKISMSLFICDMSWTLSINDYSALGFSFVNWITINKYFWKVCWMFKAIIISSVTRFFLKHKKAVYVQPRKCSELLKDDFFETEKNWVAQEVDYFKKLFNFIAPYIFRVIRLFSTCLPDCLWFECQRYAAYIDAWILSCYRDLVVLMHLVCVFCLRSAKRTLRPDRTNCSNWIMDQKMRSQWRATKLSLIIVRCR